MARKTTSKDSKLHNFIQKLTLFYFFGYYPMQIFIIFKSTIETHLTKCCNVYSCRLYALCELSLELPAQNWIHLPLYSLKWRTWHFDIFLTDLLIKKDHCYHMLDQETKMPKSQQLLPLVYGQPMKRMVKWPSTMMNLRWSLWTVRFVYSTVSSSNTL